MLFSLLNLSAHMVQYRRLRAAPRGAEGLRRIWGCFLLLSLHCWVWSAAFHARDTPLTERGDYLAAAALIAFSVFAAIARACGPSSVAARLCAAALSIGLVRHCRYMLFVRFDYGYHMQACICLGVAQTLIWLAWALAVSHPQVLAPRALPTIPAAYLLRAALPRVR